MVKVDNDYYRDSLMSIIELQNVRFIEEQDSLDIVRMEQFLKSKGHNGEINQIVMNLTGNLAYNDSLSKIIANRISMFYLHSNLIQHKLDIQTREKNRLLIIGFITFIGIVLGAIVTIKGYVLWYKRVQKPTDERIMLELKELKSKLTDS